MNTHETTIAAMDSNGNAYELEFTPMPITGETWHQYPYLPHAPSPIPPGVTVIFDTPTTFNPGTWWHQDSYGTWWIVAREARLSESPIYCYGKFVNLQVEPKRKEPKMRGLYEVYIVDPEKSTVVDSIEVVAKSPETAKFKALLKLENIEGDIDDYDIVVHKLGDVRAKKMVQEVRVVTNVMRDLEIARDLLK